MKRIYEWLYKLPLVHQRCDEVGEEQDMEVIQLNIEIALLQERVDYLQCFRDRYDALNYCLDRDGFIVEEVRGSPTKVDSQVGIDYRITIDTLKRASKLKTNKRKAS